MKTWNAQIQKHINTIYQNKQYKTYIKLYKRYTTTAKHYINAIQKLYTNYIKINDMNTTYNTI